MAYNLKIEISGLPQMTNAVGRKHWTVKAREAQKWRQLVMYMCAGKRPPRPLKKAHLILTRCSAISPDPDNLVSSFKHCVDGLVDARIIENDKLDNISMPDYRWEKTKPKSGKIKVEVQAD
jgi:hypothetical protein